MFDRSLLTRHNILFAIAAFYLLPLAILVIYGAVAMPGTFGWGIASLSLLATAIGALVLFLLMQQWEVKLLDASVSPTSFADTDSEEEDRTQVFTLLEETKNRCQQLDEQYESTREELLFAESDLNNKKEQISDFSEEIELQESARLLLIQEFESYKVEAEAHAEHQRLEIHNCHQTIQQQREAIEAKQLLSSQLEGKVRDLTYEIKTLLHLAEKAESIADKKVSETSVHHESLQLSQRVEASAQAERRVESDVDAICFLKGSVESAQRITGANHFGNRLAKVRDLSIDSYALELRRLTEAFNSDERAVILFYSVKEHRPLFINNAIKNLLDWTPEKFVQNFSSIIASNSDAWRDLVGQLAHRNEVIGDVQLQSRAGKDTDLRCALSLIPTGVFRGNCLAILYRS